MYEKYISDNMCVVSFWVRHIRAVVLLVTQLFHSCNYSRYDEEHATKAAFTGNDAAVECDSYFSLIDLMSQFV